MTQTDSSRVEMLRRANARHLVRRIMDELALNSEPHWPDVILIHRLLEPDRTRKALQLMEDDRSLHHRVRGFVAFCIDSHAVAH